VTDPATQALVAELVFREARLLDERRWTDWLALYCEDAVFWVPAFTMRGAYTESPDREINFIYIEGRAGLEDRVFRVEAGNSYASTPAPRTRHLVTAVMVDGEDERGVASFANWQVVSFSAGRGREIRTGSYEYVLRRAGQGLRIACKKVLLLEDVIDGYFDFYSV